MLKANTINNDIHNWYYQNTGKAYITGLLYKATDGVNISLKYQGWQPDASINFHHHVVLSFEYNFKNIRKWKIKKKFMFMWSQRIHGFSLLWCL
jgi:hypothetical protein